MISASHNAYQDNGIKIFGPDGFKLDDKLEKEIEALVADENLSNILLAQEALAGDPELIENVKTEINNGWDAESAIQIAMGEFIELLKGAGGEFGEAANERPVFAVIRPGAEQGGIGLLRVGDHQGQDAGVVPPAIPQPERQRVVAFDLLGQLAQDGVAHSEDLARDAVAGVGLAGLRGASGFELGEGFFECHAIGQGWEN